MYIKTRSKAAKVVKILHNGNECKSLKHFLPGLLPTTKQAVRTVAEQPVQL